MWLFDILVKEKVAVFSLLVAIFVSWSFYLRSEEAKDPVFLVGKSVTQIVSTDGQAKADLTILDRNKQPVTGSVFARKFIFINKGVRSIKTDDIYLPVVFSISDQQGHPSRILSRRITHETRPEITKARLDWLEAEGSLSVSFDVLEEDDGFMAEIIYEGEASDNLNIDGVILGTKQSPFQLNSSYEINYYFLTVFYSVIAGLAATLLIFWMERLLMLSLSKIQKMRGKVWKAFVDEKRMNNILYTLIFIIITVFMGWVLLDVNHPEREIISMFNNNEVQNVQGIESVTSEKAIHEEE